MWQSLPPSEKQATEIFRGALRVQSTVYDGLIVRFRTFPFRLLDILSEDPWDRDVAIAELLSSPECILDTYSRAFRDRWKTAAHLASEDCRMELFVFFHQVVGDTYSTERLHSKSGRRVRSRCMTQAARVKDVATTLQAGRAIPAWARLMFQDRSRKKSARRAGSVKKKKKRRRGGGGAWRAFLWHTLQDHGRGRQSFVDARAAYAALTEDQRNFYRELGRMATQNHQAGLPAFPASLRKLQKQRRAESDKDVGEMLSLALKDLGTLRPLIWSDTQAIAGLANTSEKQEVWRQTHSPEKLGFCVPTRNKP